MGGGGKEPSRGTKRKGPERREGSRESRRKGVQGKGCGRREGVWPEAESVAAKSGLSSLMLPRLKVSPGVTGQGARNFRGGVGRDGDSRRGRAREGGRRRLTPGHLRAGGRACPLRFPAGCTPGLAGPPQGPSSCRSAPGAGGRAGQEEALGLGSCGAARGSGGQALGGGLVTASSRRGPLGRVSKASRPDSLKLDSVEAPAERGFRLPRAGPARRLQGDRSRSQPLGPANMQVYLLFVLMLQVRQRPRASDKVHPV